MKENEEVTKNTRAKEIERFLTEHGNAFDTPDKKAAFLEGVLTQFLLDVQYASRQSTPFRSKLYGLKLDEKRLKRLFPKITEKFREYRRVYPWLEKATSKYLIKAEEHGWSLSKDEISYYFALGLNLGRIFK